MNALAQAAAGTSRRGWIAGAAFVACLAGLALGAAGSGRSGVVCGSLLVLLVGSAGAVRLRRDPLDAPGLYAAAAAVMFGLLSLVWLGRPPVPGPGLGPDDISRALLLVAAALALLVIGAWVAAGRPRRREHYFVSSPPSVRALVALFVVSVVGALVGVAVGGIGYNAASSPGLLKGAQVFTQLSTLGTLVILAAAILTFRSRPAWHPRVLVALIAVQIVVGFIGGYKGASAAPAILTGIAYVSATGRVPWRALAISVLATVVVLVPANAVYRQLLRTPQPGSTTTQTVADRLEFFVLGRFRLVDHVALIEKRTPSEYPYAHGLKYRSLLQLAVVPRVVWPDKPILDDALDFSHTYWEVPSGVHTSTPMTQPGDLYRNFGLPGALVGMLTWGVAIGGFSRLLARRASPRAELLFLFVLFTAVVNIEVDIPQVVATGAKTIPTAAVAAWLLLPGRGSEPGYRQIQRKLRPPAMASDPA